MKSILLLVHRIPYPPDKGDKIRSYNILRFLSARYLVYLGAFVDDSADFAHRALLEDECAGVCLRGPGKWRSKVGSALSLVRGQALGVGYYHDRKMSQWIDKVLSQKAIDGIFIFSSVMAQYIPEELSGYGSIIVDFVDVDSDKWRQYSERVSWPLSLVYRYEAQALQRWEKYVASRVDAVTLVSDTETNLLRGLLSDPDVRVETVRNGVDADYFNPRHGFESPYRDGLRVVVFTGAMDYYANQEAVAWFAENPWSELREHDPDLEFYIVGSNPTKAVRELSRINGITVTGRVPDIRPYLSHAAIAIAPLKLARGVQNKVLEALAMSTPVAATPAALQGLDGKLPDSIGVAERGRGFVQLMLEQLSTLNSESGGRGREFIRQNYDWNRNLAAFEELLFLNRGDRQ